MIPEHQKAVMQSCQRVVRVLHARFDGSQAAMSRATGVSHSKVSKVIGGRQSPGQGLLAKLCQKANVDGTWLLTGSGSMTPPRRDSDAW